MTRTHTVRDRRLIAAGVAPAAAAIFSVTGSFIASHTAPAAPASPVAQEQVEQSGALAVANAAPEAQSGADHVAATFAAVRAEIAALRREIKFRKRDARRAKAAAYAAARAAAEAPTPTPSAPRPASHSTTGASGGG